MAHTTNEVLTQLSSVALAGLIDEYTVYRNTGVVPLDSHVRTLAAEIFKTPKDSVNVLQLLDVFHEVCYLVATSNAEEIAMYQYLREQHNDPCGTFAVAELDQGDWRLIDDVVGAAVGQLDLDAAVRIAMSKDTEV